MSDERTIEAEIDQVQALHTLVTAYEEIASIRMKKTRDSVLMNRQFQDAVSNVFEQVRASYAHQVMELAKSREGRGAKKITFLAHNGKTVALLLSANTGLYGDIVKKTFDLFTKEIRQGVSEATIVGRQGLSQFLAEEPDRPYTYFDLPDYTVTSEQVTEIIKHIVQYEEIHVYFGKFISVLTQKPSTLSISAEIELAEGKGREPVKYIFEPTLEQILMFFETEIFASLFEQTVRESQLAKFASRVLAMDRASENIKENLTKLNFRKLRIAHRVANRKQLESLASTHGWGGRNHGS